MPAACDLPRPVAMMMVPSNAASAAAVASVTTPALLHNVPSRSSAMARSFRGPPVASARASDSVAVMRSIVKCCTAGRAAMQCV